MEDQGRGFTFIELLIVVSFILLFSGLSIGYYSQYTEQKRLENASKRISTILTLVRQKMISGDSTMCAPTPFVTPEISYYAFEVTDSDTYKILPFCSQGGSQPVVYTNEQNVKFITPIPAAPLPVVTFFPVTGASVCNYVYLRNNAVFGDKKCRYVKINQSGVVNDNACSDCTSCPVSCP